MAYLRYHTHIATSIAAGAGVAITGEASFTFPYVVGIAIGALLPDIDEPNSYIGRRSLGLAKVIKSILDTEVSRILFLQVDLFLFTYDV